MVVCKQKRRYKVTYYTLNTITRKKSDKGHYWVESDCNIPLTTEQVMGQGLCRNCLNGWSHPNNYPV